MNTCTTVCDLCKVDVSKATPIFFDLPKYQTVLVSGISIPNFTTVGISHITVDGMDVCAECLRGVVMRKI